MGEDGNHLDQALCPSSHFSPCIVDCGGWLDCRRCGLRDDSNTWHPDDYSLGRENDFRDSLVRGKLMKEASL